MTTAVNPLMLEQLQNVLLVSPGSQTRTLVAGCKTRMKSAVILNIHSITTIVLFVI
jgi:hypothetical protein